ncbi:hypothetical protein KDA_73420 [Dictyobacter alpinus]|uniref:Uncharacterized protein n=1 Tax=Dictyobacter alpinus TaxID=2014873 RepID=A0A402BKG8_9CHLR|nr:hypothetical protein KDA_73420 [Dictyobacter alpinus]
MGTARGNVSGERKPDRGETGPPRCGGWQTAAEGRNYGNVVVMREGIAGVCMVFLLMAALAKNA